MATVVFDWENDHVVDIKLHGGVWPDMRDFPVTTKPFTIRLPAGSYTAKITYRHADKEYTFERPLNVGKLKESQLHVLGPMIEEDLQRRTRTNGVTVKPLGNRVESETGKLILDWDESQGLRVTYVLLTTVISFGRQVQAVHEVTERPFTVPLPAPTAREKSEARCFLNITVGDATGRTRRFSKMVAADLNQETRVDLGQDIGRHFPNGLVNVPGGADDQ
jgi:hypothetical protein